MFTVFHFSYQQIKQYFTLLNGTIQFGVGVEHVLPHIIENTFELVCVDRLF